MRVRVFAPAFLDLGAVDDDGYMELEEGSSLNDVYKRLKVPLPLRPILFCTVNYGRERLGVKLKDGDCVSFITPIAGG
jgi:molybdopterin converting factor small subunit